MSNFQHKSFLKYDDYITPKYAWEDIKHLIPKNKKIWEEFYCDGKSGNYLKELGFDVIHQEIDFFKHDLGDIIVSNPPFTMYKEILIRLKELKKPFIMIMPSSKLNTKTLKIFKDEIQIIIPKKRIHFIRDGDLNYKSNCNFDCFYYCYKIGLDKDILFL